TAAALVTFWLVSLHVSPEAFGRCSLYLAALGAAAMLLVNWPNAALLRYGREEWVQRQRVGETLAARGLLYAAGVIATIGLAWLLDPLLRAYLSIATSPFWWLVLGIVLMPVVEMAIYAHQAVGRRLPYGYAPLVSRVTFLAAVALIPVAGIRAEWDYLAAAMAAGWLLSATLVILTFPRDAWCGLRPTRAALRRILGYSWAIPLGALAAYTVNWVDAWVIRIYLGPEAVGIYTWAYQITAIGGLAFAPLGALLIPSMVDAHVAGDLRRLSRHGQRSLRLVVLVGALGTIVLAVVYPLLSSLAGPGYRGSYPVILLLLAAIPFQLLGYLMNPLMAPFESLVPKGMLMNAGLAVANVIGDLVLVPLVGITGAAIATWGVFCLRGACSASAAGCRSTWSCATSGDWSFRA
ncbi:MAG: oligosaccharide flippase family protein, partial [Chloroflexi bacterium]|nr:oligosaccharide flippase family protein [Chloroflexota bacterium]